MGEAPETESEEEIDTENPQKEKVICIVILPDCVCSINYDTDVVYKRTLMGVKRYETANFFKPMSSFI